MTYSDTWFAKQPMTMCSSWGNDRQLWLHHYVDVMTGGLQPMHRKNPDGSIDVLGVELRRMSSGLSIGSYNREKIQKSLANHAEKLKSAGATIVKQTKNTLVARHGSETAYYVITHVKASTFYRNLERE